MGDATPATGAKRLAFLTAGLPCAGTASPGPVPSRLPATPWVLAASYCFARSSPRLRRWLLRSPLFGKLLRDWHDHGGMRRPAKVLAVGMVLTACTFSVGFAGLPDWLRVAIACCGATGVGVILFVVPTVRPPAGPSVD